MATKDWKLIGRSTWLNTSKTRHRMIIVDKNTGGNYNIILGTASGERTLLKIHKTKSASLKFAKRYMRTH